MLDIGIDIRSLALPLGAESPVDRHRRILRCLGDAYNGAGRLGVVTDYLAAHMPEVFSGVDGEVVTASSGWSGYRLHMNGKNAGCLFRSNEPCVLVAAWELYPQWSGQLKDFWFEVC